MASLRREQRRGMLFALTLVLVVVAGAGRAEGNPVDRWNDLIGEASRRFGVPDNWIRSVIWAESRGETTLGGRPITSPAGAMGLMQIMPDTWTYLRHRYDLGVDAYDPHDNIFAGTAFLAELYRKYGYPNLFAAYNAGPSRLDDFLQAGLPLPNETRGYLAELMVPVAKPETSVSVPRGGGLFFDLHVQPAQPSPAARGALFSVLRPF